MTGVRLGRPEREPAAAPLAELSGYPDTARLEVDIGPAQRGQLAPAQAAENGEQHQGAVPIGHRVGQGVDLRILLVRKTYGNGWDIPGGYAEIGESPAAACQRELKEELGIHRDVQRLLVVDWAPLGGEGDKILYIFDCGELGADQNRIQLAGNELDRWEWVSVYGLTEYVIPRLARRLISAHHAYSAATPVYLEHGESALPLP